MGFYRRKLSLGAIGVTTFVIIAMGCANGVNRSTSIAAGPNSGTGGRKFSTAEKGRNSHTSTDANKNWVAVNAAQSVSKSDLDDEVNKSRGSTLSEHNGKQIEDFPSGSAGTYSIKNAYIKFIINKDEDDSALLILDMSPGQVPANSYKQTQAQSVLNLNNLTLPILTTFKITESSNSSGSTIQIDPTSVQQQGLKITTKDSKLQYLYPASGSQTSQYQSLLQPANVKTYTNTNESGKYYTTDNGNLTVLFRPDSNILHAEVTVTDNDPYTLIFVYEKSATVDSSSPGPHPDN